MKRTITTFVLIFLFAMLVISTVSAEVDYDKLRIDHIEVKIDGDKDSGADEHGGSFEVVPESKIDIKIKLTSLFDDDIEGEDVDIEDIEIEAVMDDVEGDEIDDVSDDFDLSPGRHKTVTLSLEMPLRLMTDEIYPLEVTITGEDENNTKYDITIDFDVEVDKERHEIRVLSKEIYPTKVKPGSTVQARMKLINTGSEDEDIVFTLRSEDLGFSYSEEFEMLEDIDDDDNEYGYTAMIPVKTGTAAGTYPVILRAVYDDGDEFVEETLNVIVEAISIPKPVPVQKPVVIKETEKKEVKEEVEVISQPIVQPVQTTPSYVVSNGQAAVATPRTSYGSANESWWDKNKWIAVILITDLILLIAAVTIVMVVLKRRRN